MCPGVVGKTVNMIDCAAGYVCNSKGLSKEIILCPPGLVCLGKVATDDPEDPDPTYIANKMRPLKCIKGHMCLEGTNTDETG